MILCLMPGSVTPIPEDANALRVIRIMKNSAGGNPELYIPAVYSNGKRELNQFQMIQNPQNGNYKGLYWSKRSKQYLQLHKSTNKRDQRKSIYWSKRSEDQDFKDFKDFLPFSTIIRHDNLMQPDQLFLTNV